MEQMQQDIQRVVVIDAGYDSYEDERSMLEGVGATLEVFDGGRHDSQGKAAFAQGAAGVFVRWTDIDGPFLDAVRWRRETAPWMGGRPRR